jgi:translocation and assembly module TamB
MSLESPYSTQLPAPPKRRSRRGAVGRAIARALCVVFAIVGLLPFAGAAVVRSPWARAWAVRESSRLLQEHGIVAKYSVDVRFWPLSIELTDVSVASNDGGAPLVATPRVRVKPRVLPLLSGKVEIDEITIDAPRIRAVVRDGKLVSFDLPKTDTSTPSPPPTKAPFDVFAITDAEVDLDIDGSRLLAHEVDADVTADPSATRGSLAVEVAARIATATFRRTRTSGDPARPVVATDDDILCGLDGRVRYEDGAITVHRLVAQGAADLDPAPGSTPSCDLPKSDKRRVELSLSHLDVVLPKNPGDLPHVDGQAKVRLPLGVIERAASLPETDGWFEVDVEGRFADDTAIPDLSGHLSAHDIRIAQFNFAKSIESDVVVRRNVVTSPKTTILVGDGTVVLTDTVVEPLSPGAVLKKTRLDATGASFASLLRDLGIHPHAHVGWAIREIHVPIITGTFAPLHLDGDFTARTSDFGVYDRPSIDPSRVRLFGFTTADIAAHLAVRPDGVKFQAAHVKVGKDSDITGGFVSLGFRNDIHVDVGDAKVDLEDISPLGPVPISGHAEMKAVVAGRFEHPEPSGTVISMQALKIADVSFGDLSGGKVKVDVDTTVVDIAELKAKKGTSDYFVPTAKLDFGRPSGGVAIDAVATTPSFGVDDLLSMFALDKDPRFEGISARFSTDGANVHVAMGGPEDKCGGGFISVRTKPHLTDVTLFGESFVKGDADIDLTWEDRAAGIAGANLDVRSFVLTKAMSGTDGVGNVLGSASIRRGGALSAHVVVDSLPVARVDSLGPFAHQIDGRLSAVAQVQGNLDEFTPKSGFTIQSQVEVTPLRVRGVAFGGSQLRLKMTQVQPLSPRTGRVTGCGAPIGAPFDPEKYARDESSHGSFIVDGSLFGRTVSLDHLELTRAKSPHLKGVIRLRGLDIGALARAATTSTTPDESSTPVDIAGELWADVDLTDVPLLDLSKTDAHLVLAAAEVRRGDQRISVQPPKEPIFVHGDNLTLPKDGITVLLRTPGGFSGGLDVVGGIANLSRGKGAVLGISATLRPIDLAQLAPLIPKVDRASGSIGGQVALTGPLGSPSIAGTLKVRAEEILVNGFAGAMRDVVLDVHADAHELTATGAASFAGGSVKLTAFAPVNGTTLGALDATLQARGLHLTPADGVAAALDADLRATYDAHAAAVGGGAHLPHISGDVTLTSLDYTRAVNLTTDLSALGGKAKRTEVNSYDPSLDSVVFDVRVRAAQPMRIKNNLVDLKLVIDSGSLAVTGTNQRFGLRGSLKSLNGGHFRFQGSDFEIRQGIIRFDDPTRIAPNVDVVAVTEYRRYTDAGSAGAATSSGGGGLTGSGALWRITLHAYGDSDDLRIELTSEPPLSQEDIVLLLTVGMTRAEIDQLQASSLGASIALSYLGAASGADRAVTSTITVIDDFRFGTGTTKTGNVDPQLTVGKRVSDNLRASVTSGFSEDRELRSNIAWRLSNRVTLEGSYDNINDVASSSIGNIGLDLRWRLEFE